MNNINFDENKQSKLLKKNLLYIIFYPLLRQKIDDPLVKKRIKKLTSNYC